METSYKRKLDCIVDTMDVIVPDHYSYLEGKCSKRVKISLNARVEPYSVDYPDSVGAFQDHFPEADVFRSSSYSCDGSMVVEDETKSLAGGREDLEDIPSTSEVIDSLRKVMLWMSAQEDHNSDHIEYLTNVERYALSKRDSFVQQRKITEYFVKNSD
ncbi:hypothetical protein AAG570_006056 [Ranatra chinensis]|uniref:Uncharacterized protein n=1 Tax=Ranatra chinensis TaxID=642074 RepID=A0ABD0XWX5_9HEMI